MRIFACALLALAACEVGDQDLQKLAIDDHVAGQDPCKDPQIESRATVHATVDGHHFVGTNGPDVIVGTEGADVIFGLGGDDLICGLGGDDLVDGGDGRDLIFAGDGDDIVHGRGGSDRIYGGPGNDVLFGDILDDDLHGEGGDDVLIGGHGTDLLDGGAGDDFLRGDTGNDTFDGGDGYDTASFATALPPGQPEVKNDGSANPITGVAVTDDADGDGGNEPVRGIEQIIGSAFRDRIEPMGRDVPPTIEDTPESYVGLSIAKDHNKIVDAGVLVLGSAGADDLQIFGSDNNIKVVAGAPITAGEGCVAVDAKTVRCDTSNLPLHFVLAWGASGNDHIQFFGSFPRDFEAHASGGEGSDHLIGADEQDVFFTGTDGEDWLEGKGGDDALIGESHHTLAWANDARPEVANYHDGADIFDGGDGNDQLVVDYVCGGHRYIGGPGHDIAGFARSGKHGIWAQLGGPTAANEKTRWWGKAANMDLCGGKEAAWTTWRTGVGADLEVLEASDGPDHLWGDDRANTIWGRGGGDTIFGLGGDDEILGADGNDTIDGGAGHNTIRYGGDE